jgi:hypothetical protein
MLEFELLAALVLDGGNPGTGHLFAGDRFDLKKAAPSTDFKVGSSSQKVFRHLWKQIQPTEQNEMWNKGIYPRYHSSLECEGS